jgi:hypothetical protein
MSPSIHTHTFGVKLQSRKFILHIKCNLYCHLLLDKQLRDYDRVMKSTKDVQDTTDIQEPIILVHKPVIHTVVILFDTH